MGCFHETIALDILAPDMSITLMPIQEMGTQAVQILLENIGNKDFTSRGVVVDNLLMP